jgi:hypothetical protein
MLEECRVGCLGLSGGLGVGYDVSGSVEGMERGTGCLGLREWQGGWLGKAGYTGLRVRRGGWLDETGCPALRVELCESCGGAWVGTSGLRSSE